MKVVNIELKQNLIELLATQKETRKFDLADSKLWYVTNAQARKYIDLFSGDYAESMVSTEYALLEKNLNKIFSALPNSFNFLSLGPGMAEKDKLILFNAILARKNISYSAIDVQELFLEKTSEQLQDLDIEKQYFVGDFISDLSYTLQQSNGFNFIYLGATYGNYDSDFILSHLYKSLDKDDSIYLSTQLYPENRNELLNSYASAKDVIEENIETLGLSGNSSLRFNEQNNSVEFYQKVTDIPKELEDILQTGDEIVFARSRKPTLVNFKDSISAYFDGDYFATTEFAGFIGRKK